MLGFVVFGSRTWICTIAAPALAASIADAAIACGVTGTAGFLPGESADPVTAQLIMIFRLIGLTSRVASVWSDEKREMGGQGGLAMGAQLTSVAWNMMSPTM